MDWVTAEIRGMSYFSEKGAKVLVPLVRNDGYDFVVETCGVFKRVNVKVAGLKDKREHNSWAISQASGKARSSKDSHTVDIYLVWLPSENKFIELDGGFLNGGRSKSKRLRLKAHNDRLG